MKLPPCNLPWKVRLLLLYLPFCFIETSSANAAISGEQKKWHKIAFTFTGPNVCENSVPNPFLNYRMQVTFTAPGGQVFNVPGFFAAGGNASETSDSCGNKWRAYFVPDETGLWTYSLSFLTGTNISINDTLTGIPVAPLHGTSDTFSVFPTDKTGNDFRAKGMLRYVGQHYMQFAETGKYFLKGGTDSPENFLAYYEFDQTYNLPGGKGTPGLTDGLHRYTPHVQDWVAGDPSWKNGKGKGMIGALNYLASRGMNSAYFITYNIDGGDGMDTWVWTHPEERQRFDVSKLDQWEIVFSHMDKLGIQLHLVMQEQENDLLLGGNGNLNNVRKLYYRELVARFSHHLAIQWNIGEENQNSDADRAAFAAYIRSLDAYDHPITFHIDNNLVSAYNGVLNNPQWLQYFEATSIQGLGENYNEWAEELTIASSSQGKKWAVYGDEQNPMVDPANGNLKTLREALWGNLLGGGAGVEWYFGYQGTFGDVQSEDWRIVDTLWRQTKYALDFFQNHLPFTEMQSGNALTSANNDYCFSKLGAFYAVYLPFGSSSTISLTSEVYDVKWYDPRTGGNLLSGSLDSIMGSASVSIGNPPYANSEDWIALVRLKSILNAPVSIRLTNPKIGSFFLSPANININAEVTDFKDSVTAVRFYAGNNLLGQDLSEPYSLVWQNVMPGNYSIKAQAVYINNSVLDESIVNITVAPSAINKYVIAISVDGLRPDAITNLGPAQLPNFYKFRTQGVFTDNARADIDITRTLPNHTSMITGRPVNNYPGAPGHGWTENDDPGSDNLHLNKGSYVASVFDMVHDNSLRTAMYASKTKFVLYDQSYDSQNGRLDTIGADNGRDKMDVYLQTGSLSSLKNSFIAAMQANPFNFSFIHFMEPDNTGHGSGFNPAVGSNYSNEVKDIDELLGNIFALVENDQRLNGNTVIILTSDHGGTGTDHGDNALAVNYTVPFYVWGACVGTGLDLYVINNSIRQNPGTSKPAYSAVLQPIRNGDIANLALNLLELGSVPGSTFNIAQNLRLNADPIQNNCGSGNPNLDCAGVPNGLAFVDSCGICSGGTTGHAANSNKDVCGVCFGNGSSCQPPPICVQLEVVSFTLMHAGTAGAIGPLANGATISIATSGDFSIRANVCNLPVGSVRFILNGSTFRTESTAPYALNGDSPTGSFTKWNASPGNYTLTATPYSGSNGSGTAGISETVSFTVVSQPIVTDCYGTVNGTAFVNSCGICVGGNTGLNVNTGKDCNLVCNGTAVINTCGICVLGNTGLGVNAGKDCNGICNGAAMLDSCVICAGGNTGIIPNSAKDCNGVCFGSAEIDVCGICGGNNSTCLDCNGVPNGSAVIDLCGVCNGNNSTCLDCAGTPNGTAFFDSCGICSSGSTGLIPNANKDCNGICFGSAVIDSCGICGGDGNSCRDCAGVLNGTALVDSCEVCSGGTTGLIPNSNKDCNGICFGSAVIDSCGVCGGDGNSCRDCAGALNGIASVDDCSICSGGTTGLIPNANKDCNGICFGLAVIDSCGVCGGDGNSCRDCNGVLFGGAVIDQCGVCGGNNSTCLDCAGVPGGTAFTDDCEVCSGGTTLIIPNVNKDCNGLCFGTAHFNSCNICVGGNTGLSENSGKDCNGVCGGTATLNQCNICVGGTNGLGQNAGKDCNGVCGGSATLNQCNICVGGNTGLGQNAGKDCNGVCGGTATLNQCNICVGGTTGLGQNAGKDCNGVCNGTATLNQCNICVGGNTGLGQNAGKDCNGVCNGTASVDNCGVCSGGNTGIVPNSSCPPPCVQNEVISFSLMRTGTAGVIGTMTNGMVINKATVGSFSIRANVCSTPVGSVKFTLNGSTKRIETGAPYALNGDSPVGSFTAWNAAVGSYTLIGTPYTGANATGTAGVTEIVTFSVINQANPVPDCNGVIGGTAHFNSCNICVGGNTGLPETAGKDCNGVCNGTASLNQCNICVGGNTGQTQNAGKDCNGVCNGTASIDNCNVCSGGNTGIVPNSTCTPPCVQNEVVSFTLVRAGTAGTIGPLTNGMVINKAAIGSFSVRANVCSTPVGSVKFTLNGVTKRIETGAPYAINGDSPVGSYTVWNPSAGSYTLIGRPYTGANASGTAGIAETVTFSVVNSASKTSMETGTENIVEEIAKYNLEVYPNPNSGSFHVKLSLVEPGDIVLKVFNPVGQELYTLFLKNQAGELEETINLNNSSPGIYLIELRVNGESLRRKIAVRN